MTMKKLMLAVVCALPMLGLASCSDDEKSLPNVDFSLNVADGTEVYENQLYVVSGDSLTIAGIDVINNEQGKAALIPYADYYFDGAFIGRSVVLPYGIKVPMEAGLVSVGKHTLGISCPVYAVDKEIAFAALEYTVNVVADQNDMPEGTQNSHVSSPALQDTEPTM